VNQIGGICTTRFYICWWRKLQGALQVGPLWHGGFCGRFAAGFCGIQGNNVQGRDLQSFVDALIVKAQ